MPNTAVRAAGEAVPAAKSLMSRRSMLGGLVASPIVALPVVAKAATMPLPLTQTEIAYRVHDLAGELSKLLDQLDGRTWSVRVRPTFHGIESFDIEPMNLPAAVRLERGLKLATAALGELQPGAWRSHRDVDAGFAVIVNDSSWGKKSTV